MEKKYDMHVIMNTHWDREWRWSFRETQMRLLTAMDMVLDGMAQDDRFQAFHTDSQTSMVDDYLELRPERRAEVEKRVSEERLQIGPWYTLPAEYLVSGESLVRNLLLGHRIANDLGGTMKAAYNIFSWGQVSQLPQLYRQFGMETITFYRGVDQSSLDSLEFWWEAPDGNKSLCVTFGAQHRINFWANVYRKAIMNGVGDGLDRAAGDGFTVNLADPYSNDINHWLLDQQKGECTEEELREWTEALIDTVKDKSSTDHLMFYQGFDLENPDLYACDLIERIGKLGFGDIKVSTIPEAFKRIRASLAESGQLEKLPVLAGEMLEAERIDARFGQLFPGVWSARMPVKLANANSEAQLERWAEPTAAWASWVGGFEYPIQQINVAWKELLKNEQHDGIGGCHVDRVTHTMIERNRDVDDLAKAVTRSALQHVVAQVDCSQLDEKEVGVLAFNPTIGSRSGIFEATIDIPEAYLAGNGVYVNENAAVSPKQLIVKDTEGNEMPVQVVDQWKETVFTYRKFAVFYPKPTRRIKVLVDGGLLPPMGYKGFVASHSERLKRPNQTLSPKQNVMENEFLRATIQGDGTIALSDKENGTSFENLHYWVDQAELGGPLLHIDPADSGALSTLGHEADVSRVYAGPLEARYRIERTWMIPEKIDADLRKYAPQAGEWIESDRPKRSAKKAPLTITTEVTLRKGSRKLEFKTVINNQASDHRLRLLLPTGLDPKVSVADSPFDAIERDVAVPDATGWGEPAVRCWPSSSWVDVSNGTNGLAFVHLGIPEYEVLDGSGGDLAVTFLRSFSIRGGMGESFEDQPVSQCHGKNEYVYAIMPHAGDWKAGRLFEASAELASPTRVAQTTKHAGKLPMAGTSFLSFDRDELVVTALKQAENGEGFVLRGFNPSGSDVHATLTSGVPLMKVERVMLEELPGDELPILGNKAVKLTVKAGEIFNVRLVATNN